MSPPPPASWQSFCASSTTLPPSPGVRRSWHQGRRAYAVWLLPITAPQVLARMARVQALLPESVHRVAPRQAHVTIWVGGFLDGDGTRSDDLAERERAELQAAVERLGPLRLSVLGVDSFATCPYLQVEDPYGHLARARDAMQEVGVAELRFAAFRPHLTLGSYTQALPIPALTRTLSPLRELPPLELSVRVRAAVVDARDGSWRESTLSP